MAEKKLYVACIILQDDAGDFVGLTRPVIAESESEALDVAQTALLESIPDAASMPEKIRDVKEIPMSFVEQIATEVLGWRAPEEADR